MVSLLTGELLAATTLPNVWWGVSVEDRKYGVPRIAHLQRALIPLRFVSIEPLLEDLGTLDLRGIHWAIVGGESGHGARQMEESWVLSVLRECQRQKVRFFFKQWGGVMKKRNGRTLLGKTWNDMPDRHLAAMADPQRRKELQMKFDEIAESFSPVAIRRLLTSRPSLEAIPMP